MSIVKTINGFNFYFETLDFQGDNKKFYINLHADSSLKSFDIVINKNWIDKVGFEEAIKYVSKVWDNPKKFTEMTLGEYNEINSKIKYYRDKALENENKIIENKCKKKIGLIGNIEDKIVGEFKKLNAIGQVRALELLEDLITLNKYRA